MGDSWAQATEAPTTAKPANQTLTARMALTARDMGMLSPTSGKAIETEPLAGRLANASDESQKAGTFNPPSATRNGAGFAPSPADTLKTSSAASADLEAFAGFVDVDDKRGRDDQSNHDELPDNDDQAEFPAKKLTRPVDSADCSG